MGESITPDGQASCVSIRHFELPLCLRQKPIKSGSWCVVCDGRSACYHFVHMVEHLLKNNFKINFLKNTLLLHNSITCFQNQKKMNSTGTSPVDWFYKEK